MADLAARLSAALEGRYRVEHEVGEGGMATVFLATDIRHDRRVALKVIRAEMAQLLGPERFLREIRIAARLDHPNILALYDSGDAGGLLYYVMPYVDGESLRDRMTREGQLPIGDALRLAGQDRPRQGTAAPLDGAGRRGQSSSTRSRRHNQPRPHRRHLRGDLPRSGGRRDLRGALRIVRGKPSFKIDTERFEIARRL